MTTILNTNISIYTYKLYKLIVKHTAINQEASKDHVTSTRWVYLALDWCDIASLKLIIIII